jgi:methylglutaconyl-CoA hydratase
VSAAGPDATFTRYELRSGAAWITLASPATRNALSAALVAALARDLERALRDPAARSIVLTGEGAAFCAGADLKAGGIAAETGSGNPFVRVLRLVRDGEKPVIAAVNGAAFGGGLGLVAAADIAIGAQSARMGFSEVRVGVIPAMISVVVIPAIGERNALRLFVTGERLDAQRALEVGLLHRVVPDAELVRAVEAEAAAIAEGGPIAVREAKALVRRVTKLAPDEAYAYTERKIAELFASEEAAEGMRAFAEKRPPRWSPRAARGPQERG